MEIDPNEGRVDCARACDSSEEEVYIPSCGYVDGICKDLNEKPACKSYKDANGCTVTKCGDGTETVECPAIPSGKYVTLDEKFGLVDGQSAKVTDYGYMKLTLNNWMCTGACENNNNEPCDVSCAISLEVDMPSKCESTASESGCTGTGTQITLSEGQSQEAFGAKISYLDKQGQEAMLIVQKRIPYREGVDIEISPSEQSINYGDKAVYKIIVADKRQECESDRECIQEPYTYFIDVQNLPFLKEYPKQIELDPGESKTIELVVRPYIIDVEENTNERAVSSSTSGGGGSSATGYAIAKPTKVKETSIEKANIASSKKSEVARSIAPSAAEKPIEVKQKITGVYRTHKFNVRAMQKNNPKNQDIAYGVLSIKPKGPPINPPEFPGEDVNIKIYKGWNLISLPGKLIKFEKISLDKKLVGFVYIKEQQRYVSLSEAQNILGEKFGEYLARNSFWVYSYENIELKVKVDREVSYNDIELKKGWNLVPITEDMLGGYLNDIKGDCEFEKLYLWDAASQRWEKIDESYQFSDRLLNYGFLIKVKEDCRLGGAVIALTPPAMPE